MARVKQAACPGCKAVLRIPAEWLGQSIRCKACGALVQTRPASSPSRPAVPPPPPSPPSRKVTPAAPPAGNVFDFDGPADDTPVRRRPRRRRSVVGTLVTLFLLLLLTGGLAAATYLHWERISERIPGTQSHAESTARKEKEKEQEREKEKEREKAAAGPYPRRALVISVHNYLYANPLPAPSEEDPGIRGLITALGEKLMIPEGQLFHLSDAAEANPRPPLKAVIREGLSNFLKTSRAQDRILVFFVGHTAELDGKPYLVPLEGELTDAKNLIPLDEVLAEMAKCPARQKVFVLDGNRYNPSQGEDRPGSGPMGEKLEALLKSPPAGVEVMASCSKGQRSYELGDVGLGAYLNAFRMALAPRGAEKGAVDGMIQGRDELLPLAALHKAIGVNLGRAILMHAPQDGDGDKREPAKQTPLLAGKPPDGGAAYDPAEAAAQAPAIPAPKMANPQLIKTILSEISLPPLKGGEAAALDVTSEGLPPFPEAGMKKYETGDLPADSPVRLAIREARVFIWAVSAASPPKDLAADVREFRSKHGDAEGRMIRAVGKGEPANKNAFEARMRNNSKKMAGIVHAFEMLRDKLELVAKEAKSAPPRWQASFSLVRGRLLAQLAYLEEYQGAIGQMLREVPPLDAKHTGWRLAAKKKAGDASGRRYDKQATTLFKAVSSDHAETPWDVLARREMLNNLGLEWQAY